MLLIMNKLVFVLILLGTVLVQLRAEKSIHAVEIRYEVYVENKDNHSTFQYNLPYETFHVVSPDRVLTLNKYAADVDEIHLYDLSNKLDYQCFMKGQGQNIAVQSPLSPISSLIINKNDDQIYQIGGMRCKKYEILVKNELVEIYTTDVFGVNFTPFSEIKGYAMQYTFVDDVYGKVTYVAKSIYPTTYDESTFSLEGFQIKQEVFPQDLRNTIDETLIAKESKSLFKLNKKNIDYKFKLANKAIITNNSNPNNLAVFTVCGFHKLRPIDIDLMKSLIYTMRDKNVDFYFFANKRDYSKTEIEELQDAGFKVAYLKDLILSKFKIDYFPTYILLDKDRKVIKYKIGTDSDMLSEFTDKILELNDD